MDFFARTWVEIDKKAILDNYKIICKKNKCKVIPVVKADAYSHGAAEVCQVLENNGADLFAVSNIYEALHLREAGIKCDILILGYTPFNAVNQLAENNIIQCIFSSEYAQELNLFAKKENLKIRCHIKLDTGMGRIGFDCRGNSVNTEEIKSVMSLEHLEFEGIFTHFSVADGIDEDNIRFTENQYKKLLAVTSELENSGFKFKIKHCCNSAASVKYPFMVCDAVRVGNILYGLSPSENIDLDEDFTPAMSMYSVVSMVKEIKAGDYVSYGRTFKAEKNMKIATISTGYGDGVPRALSNKGYVLINGKKANIIGRVCMDQLCVDVTDIDDVSIGSKVEIFGKNLSVDIVAKLSGTINYEIICGISKRVLKIFI
ncbi:MAG: alanine racemase [Clostridia bacterium]|nr:alanine racemase [Clostridia bacterium]